MCHTNRLSRSVLDQTIQYVALCPSLASVALNLGITGRRLKALHEQPMMRT